MALYEKVSDWMGFKQNPEYDQYEEAEYMEEEVAQTPARRSGGFFRSRQEESMVTEHHESSMKIVLLQPYRLEEAQTISRGLLDGKVVVFDLQSCDIGVAQDIVNFVSGTVFALGGTIQKINDHGSIFVAVPPSVSLQNALKGGINDADYGPFVESWVNHQSYTEVD